MEKTMLFKASLSVVGAIFISVLSQHMWMQSRDTQIHREVIQGLNEAWPVYPYLT